MDYNQLGDEQLDTTQEQCVEALTSAAENNWQYQYCGKPRPFVCTVPIGTNIYLPDEINQGFRVVIPKILI